MCLQKVWPGQKTPALCLLPLCWKKPFDQSWKQKTRASHTVFETTHMLQTSNPWKNLPPETSDCFPQAGCDRSCRRVHSLVQVYQCQRDRGWSCPMLAVPLLGLVRSRQVCHGRKDRVCVERSCSYKSRIHSRALRVDTAGRVQRVFLSASSSHSPFPPCSCCTVTACGGG